MKCPNCKDTNLVMSERQGIEIDYCPECRGVWLDRGELDKIIERFAVQAPRRMNEKPIIIKNEVMIKANTITRRGNTNPYWESCSIFEQLLRR